MSDLVAAYFLSKGDLPEAFFTCQSNECSDLMETAIFFEMMPFIFLSGLCFLAVFVGAIFVFCTGRSLEDFFSELWNTFLEIIGLD